MKNADFVTALKYAKSRLCDGINDESYFDGNSNIYICHCLPDGHVGDALRELISSRLEPNLAVEGYLSRLGVYPKKDPNKARLMQEFRLRWINHLIKEFS